MRKILFLLICLMISLHGISGLEISSGNVKLVLHEKISRFSLYFLADSNAENYLPLFFEQDPRTSVLSVVIDGKIYRLGESSSFTEIVEETEGGAKFIWQSNRIDIVQEFVFISSGESTNADGVRITLTAKNKTQQSLSVGFRYLFDTYLGEDPGIHFTTETLESLTQEKTASESSLMEYWISQGPDTNIGLKVMTKGEGITKPSNVVFANWKRLHDASWEYTTSPNRKFNLLPYSINDSAVSHYYPVQTISPDSTASIVTVMGNVSVSDDHVYEQTAAVEKVVEEESSDTTEESGKKSDVLADIFTLDKLLDEINTRLSADNLDEETVQQIEKALDELKTKYLEE